MRVLITLQRRRTHRYLVNLFTKSLISEMRDLIGDREYAKAMELVYFGGFFEKEIPEEDLPALKADLMLSDCSANWDVVK